MHPANMFEGLLAAMVLSSFGHSGAAPATPALDERRVDAPIVVVTMDGTRWQEIFEGTDPTLWRGPQIPASTLVPNLYRLGTERGAFVGAPGGGVLEASGPNYVSLPGYNEIFSGLREHGCADNACAPTRHVTFLDEARARGAKVAAFTAWTRLGFALTSLPGTYPVSCGPGGTLPTPTTPNLDSERRDDDTADAALAYYEAERPDVFYLGLGEPDEHAHFGDYEGYVASIRRADEVVGRILGILDQDERGRRTQVIVLPDHGRAYDFRNHGGDSPESARVWMVAGGPRIMARGFIGSPVVHRLADVAPTIRIVLGLPPTVATSAGAPIDELFRLDGGDVGVRAEVHASL